MHFIIIVHIGHLTCKIHLDWKCSKQACIAYRVFEPMQLSTGVTLDKHRIIGRSQSGLCKNFFSGQC